jgi:resuscitation-promoting factor RpfA
MTTSKSDDPNALRDPRVDAAWRAASREEPPAALDAAILAAARREVGAGPRSTREAETMRAQRWWWPLAVAATLGAITVGLLQTVTPDRLGAPASDSAVVTDMPTPVAKAAPELVTPTPRQRATTPGGNTTSDGRAVPRANSAQRTATAERTPPRTDVPPGPETPATAPAERKLEGAPRVGAALPEPFPAAPPQPRSAAAADATSTAVPAIAGGIAPSSAPPEPLSPKTAAADPASERSPARDAAESSQSFAGRSSPPASAAGAGAQRFQEGAAARPAPLAKMAAGVAADGRVEEARVKDRPPLPVAEWIALIRRLRAEGNTTDAAKELTAFRVAHVDHEKLLPPDLRDWRPPEK